jgi:mono/diheme cytochrome c family protein
MKKKTVGYTILGLLILGAAAAALIAWQPAIDPIEPVARNSIDATLVSQGARIAALGDCMVCHTAAQGKPFAGGLALDTPFGAIYTTNITPDADTGIGRWSLAAFTRAMRSGVSRDGHLLYPAFPYQHFTRMNEKDIAAVYAYLMARDPVNAPNKPNDLRFPFNFRPLVAGWNLLFLDRGERPADPAQSAEWNLGRYLVDGPGHCEACHTPLNALGAEERSKAFSGGLIDHWDVPALNQLAHAPVPWTKDQLVSYLQTGIASEHGAAAGPMLPVTHRLADAPNSDIQAIATYLLSVQKPVPASDAATSAAAPDKTRIGQGAALFTATCASCHGAAAPMSAIGGRPSLSRSGPVNADSPRNVIQLILNGIPRDGSSPSHYMPAFAGLLNDDQIADVAAYVRATFSTKAPWPVLDTTVVTIRKETSPK